MGLLCSYFLRFVPLPHVPVLLLWGTSDKVIEPREDSVQLKHLTHPHTKGYWVVEASHTLNVDRWDHHTRCSVCFRERYERADSLDLPIKKEQHSALLVSD